MILTTKPSSKADGSDLHMYSRTGKKSFQNHLAFSKHLRKNTLQLKSKVAEEFDDTFKIVSDEEAACLVNGEEPFDLRRAMQAISDAEKKE